MDRVTWSKFLELLYYSLPQALYLCSGVMPKSTHNSQSYLGFDSQKQTDFFFSSTDRTKFKPGRTSRHAMVKPVPTVSEKITDQRCHLLPAFFFETICNISRSCSSGAFILGQLSRPPLLKRLAKGSAVRSVPASVCSKKV